MTTPILDFVRAYAKRDAVRLHMPGHKGIPALGCESLDITEIPGADDLSHPVPGGIIRESENNAASLFGAERTVYSTEGSSQCIRAMIWLAALNDRYAHPRGDFQEGQVQKPRRQTRPKILAARNAHKAFLYAAALTDLDVQWLMPTESASLCACPVDARQVREALDACEEPPIAVYLTSPDYLGGQLPIREIAQVCHARGVPLLLDQAHGAYLKFLSTDMHAITQGADMCCDSAHKTLPVLTGGAYLHIRRGAPAVFREHVKEAMSLFGSTSPSYLILASLDACNRTLAEDFCARLAERCVQLAELKERLAKRGWQVVGTEPMKLTLLCPVGLSGTALAARLRRDNMECEYADEDYLVIMPSVGTLPEQLSALEAALGDNVLPPKRPEPLCRALPEVVMRVRDAVFAPSERIPVDCALGRICAAPTISCPPAIPIAVSGERIGQEEIALFRRFGITEVSVVL